MGKTLRRAAKGLKKPSKSMKGMTPKKFAEAKEMGMQLKRGGASRRRYA